MLMMILSMTSMTLMLKLSTSWEIMIILTMLLNISMITNFPLSDTPYLLSMNLMLDTLSMLMLFLSLWIFSLMLMASQNTKQKKNKEKMFLLSILWLLIILMLCFSSSNLLLFYTWFESSLIPTLLLIILWGNQPERKKASFYIMMYTITASLPLLMMILKMSMINYHMNLSLLENYLMPNKMNEYMGWMMLMTAFMVKLPLFSVHLWLPKAHVEAPVAGSMILAAILLKLGGYGLMRMNMLINKSMSLVTYTLMSTAIIGAIMTNIMCLRQMDLKALIAYSSIGHMSLLIISTLSGSKLGQYASLIIMLTHGLTSSCLFMLTNFIYEKTNSRNIMLTKSSMISLPSLSLMWMLTISSNMALPPSLNILGEIITMMSSFFITSMMIIPLMLASLSTSIYSMYLYLMINHGNQSKMLYPSYQLKSINLSASFSHLWPLFVLITLSSKLMVWC